jgi:HEAT repeat protein
MKPVFKRLLIAGLVIVAGAVAALFLFGAREPRYRGRPASAWARDLSHPDPVVRSNAAVAIRSIGADAAPIWEKALSQKDSPLKKPFLAEARKLPLWGRRMFNRIFKPFDPDAERLAAIRALEVLGSNAPVEPALRGLRVTDPQVASMAAATLGRIGRPAVPGLIVALEDPNQGVRSLALFSLGIIGPEADQAAPTLVRQLSGSPTNSQPQILYVLGRIGPPAVAPLLEAMKSPDPETRVAAASAFGPAGPMSSNVPPALVVASRDPVSQVRLAALETLGRVQPASPESVTAFSLALRDTDPGVRLRALHSLARAWVRAAPAVPELIPFLDDPGAEFRLHAALVLEHIGPAAKDAVPALKSRLQDSDAAVRERAAAALKKIEPEPPPGTGGSL